MMEKCALDGKEFDGSQYHMIYAFVGAGIFTAEVKHLCPKHTERLISLMKTEEGAP